MVSEGESSVPAEWIRCYRSFDKRGRLNVNLPTALTDQGTQHNVIIQPGDSAGTPEYQTSVDVMGPVKTIIAIVKP